MTVWPSSPDQPDTSLTAQDLNDLRDFIRVQVAAGYAPIPVIVEEAGGAWSDLSGSPDISGGSLVCTNGLLHDEVLKRLGG